MMDEADSVPSVDIPRRNNTRIIVGSILVVCILIVVIDFASGTHYIKHGCENYISWVETHPVAGVLSIILVYTIATICLVPGSVLSLGSAVAVQQAWGDPKLSLVLSTTAVFSGASLGSTISFLLGRYLLRDWVLSWREQYTIVHAIDRALERKGFTIMLLLRLSPLVPYNVLDYLGGVTSISLRDYILALIGLLPGTIVVCAMGTTASSWVIDGEKQSRMQTILGITGIALAFVAMSVASYYAKQELNILAEQASNQDDEIVDSGGNYVDSLVDAPLVQSDSVDQGDMNNDVTDSPTTDVGLSTNRKYFSVDQHEVI